MKILLSPKQRTKIVRVLENNNVYTTDEFTHVVLFKDVIYLIDADTTHYWFDDEPMRRQIKSALSFD